MRRPSLLGLLVPASLLVASLPLLAQDPAGGPSIRRLTALTILVLDQDEALRWYTEVLGFEKRTDLSYGEGQRWLTVAPKGQEYPELSLETAAGPYAERVGKATPLVFETADCQADYEVLSARGVQFKGPPQTMPWAIQATLKDLYGNTLVLIQDVPEATASAQ